MNTVAITGRVAKDPESRSTVTTDRVKLKDGKTYVDEATGYTAEETEFHKVTCFDGLGKAAATPEKGNVVAITGRLHYSSWNDRDGVTRYGCRPVFISAGGSGDPIRETAPAGRRRSRRTPRPAPPRRA